MRTYLDFEKPIAELEGKIHELRQISNAENVTDEIGRLEAKSEKMLENTYAGLSRWQKTSVARHPARPHFSNYITGLMDDFSPLAGDRAFGEDLAIIGGPGLLRGRSVMIIGHEKGTDTQSRLKHNFGMARPEGYRKAIRLMEMAEKFNMPVITLVDTAGAYPGKGAEERGQAEAIARSTEKCLSLSVPIISVIVGEGGSGGAVALAAANKVLMLEHSIYSVISPEGCASILYKDATKAETAAEAMKVSAQDLLEIGVIDEIINEPIGGAHRDPAGMIERLGDKVISILSEMDNMSTAEIKAQRRKKFLDIGRTLGM